MNDLRQAIFLATAALKTGPNFLGILLYFYFMNFVENG